MPIGKPNKYQTFLPSNSKVDSVYIYDEQEFSDDFSAGYKENAKEVWEQKLLGEGETEGQIVSAE